MLHQPSKVMDMDFELRGLRVQLMEKSMRSVHLQKELAMFKVNEDEISHLYEIDGQELLGSCLLVQKCTDVVANLSECSIQWYRVAPDSDKRDPISGATKPVYAPEPFDVGRFLKAEIVHDGKKNTVSTSGPIDPAPGLGSYVEALVRRHDTEFNLVVTQMNGVDQQSQAIHVLHVERCG